MTIMIEKRSWDDLSKKEATAIFDEYVAGHPARVAAALAEFERYGVAPADLDFSRRSLERIWPAVLEYHGTLPENPGPLRAGEVPYWVPFRLSYAERLGPELCWTISHVAAYFAECVMRHAPLSQWSIGAQKSSVDYRQPILVVDRGPAVEVEAIVSTGVKRALERADQGGLANAQPDSLRRQFDTRLAIDPETPLDVAPVRQIPPVDVESGFDVTEVAPGVFHIEPHDDVDDQMSGKLDTLVERLTASLVGATVHREDRELIVVAAPDETHEQIVAEVERCWIA
jgi:hypothetical protein